MSLDGVADRARRLGVMDARLLGTFMERWNFSHLLQPITEPSPARRSRSVEADGPPNHVKRHVIETLLADLSPDDQPIERIRKVATALDRDHPGRLMDLRAELVGRFDKHGELSVPIPVAAYRAWPRSCAAARVSTAACPHRRRRSLPLRTRHSPTEVRRTCTTTYARQRASDSIPASSVSAVTSCRMILLRAGSKATRWVFRAIDAPIRSDQGERCISDNSALGETPFEPSHA
jgi:hypothetical protein